MPLTTIDVATMSRLWRVTAVQNQDALLDNSHDLEYFPFGFLLWESAIGLSRYMAANPEIIARRNVLEIGAGVGVPGIVARSLGASVWQTDHQKGALELAAYNAAQNGVSGIHRFLADWRTWKDTRVYDVIIGADVTYERDMHFYLEDIFHRNLAGHGAILLSDPGRPQSLEFAARLEKKGWRVAIETLPVRRIESGQTGSEVDVAILTLTRHQI